MRISIAMTTYNGSKYLNDQLKSFSQQDQAPDELIVCDDGSSDNTIKILEKFSLNAPFDVKNLSK
ncbi:MAG: glycosyltransferase [Gammaproteobacteria bacterium]